MKEELIKVRLKAGKKYHVREGKKGFRTAKAGEEFDIPERSFNSGKDMFEKVGGEKGKKEEPPKAPPPEPSVVVEEKKESAEPPKEEVKDEKKEEVKEEPKEESPKEGSLRLVSAGSGRWNVVNPQGKNLNDVPLSEEEARSLL